MTDRTDMPGVGDIAPAIESDIATGGNFSLSDHLGKWIVLFFYPMANTPG